MSILAKRGALLADAILLLPTIPRSAMRWLLILIVVLPVTFTFTPLAARAPYDDERTAEGWVWSRIKRGEIADLNLRCDPSGRTRLDSRKNNGWDAVCRRIEARFIIDVLTEPGWRDQVHGHGLRLLGAKVKGSLDLVNIEVRSELFIGESQIEGALVLTGGRFDRPVSFTATQVRDVVLMSGIHAKELWMGQGATFQANVDMSSAKIDGVVDMSGATFEKVVNANNFSVGHLFMRDGAMFKCDVGLVSVKVDGIVDLTGATFKGNVDLDGAQVGSQVAMGGSIFERTLKANNLLVRNGGLLSGNTTFKGNVELTGAKIGGQLGMVDSIFGKTVNAYGLSVGQDLIIRGATLNDKLELSSSEVQGNLFMDYIAIKNDVGLINAKAHGSIYMSGSTFEKAVYGNRLFVGQDLFVNRKAMFKAKLDLSGAMIGHKLSMGSLDSEDTGGATFKDNVDLAAANVGESVDISGSTFEKTFTADNLSTGSDVIMRGTRLKGPVNFPFARIGANFDLRNATASSIDMSGATIAREMIIGGGNLTGNQWLCEGNHANLRPAHWVLGDKSWQSSHCGLDGQAPLPKVTLRNTKVGSLQDSTDAWPPVLDLEGFKYDRLGGFGGVGSHDMRKRSTAEWRDWLDRDPTFSTQPYTQLASVLLAAGQRNAAEAIQYYGRDREWKEVYKNPNKSWLVWCWLFGQLVFWALAGYGIGTYTFWILFWILVSTLMGWAVLWFCVPNASRHGPIWCFGASLHRLLPIVKLNKEFEDFFDNTSDSIWEKPNLKRGQVFLFCVLALWGWLLGFILLAAMGTLTSNG